MTDRHKNPPKAVRMPDGLEAWYRKHAAETGQSLNAAIVAALEDYRGRHGTGTLTSMGTAPLAGHAALTASGMLSAAAPGEEAPQVGSLAPAEPAPEPSRKRAAKSPCEHRLQPGSYCRRCERMI